MNLIIRILLTVGIIGLVYLWSWLSGAPPYEIAAFFALGGVISLAVWSEK